MIIFWLQLISHYLRGGDIKYIEIRYSEYDFLKSY